MLQSTLSSGSVTQKQKCWSIEEELAVADYIQENYNSYKIQPKKVFANNMKEKLQIDCELKKILNKITAMETKYKAIKIECGKTGEGLTENTMEFKSWEGYVKKKCPYYFILDSVMKTRANIVPPYEVNTASDQESQNNANDIICINVEEEDESDTHQIGSDTDLSSPIQAPPSKMMKLSVEAKKVKSKMEKGSSSAIAEALKFQAEISGEHFRRLDECEKMKIKNDTSKLELDEKRLAMEEIKEGRQSLIEEQRLRQEFDIAKMKLDREREKEEHEIEKLKLQIELAKLSRT